jgi:Transposase DDE domain
MPIVPPSTLPDTPRVRFATPPWHDDHPQRRELERDWPADHLAYRIEAAVARLDLRVLEDTYGGTGSLPHSPGLLLRAVLFESERGHHSPATWCRDATENGPLRWLLRGARPSRSCWYAFDNRLGAVLDALHLQPLAQAIAQGLTPASRGACDGTFIAAEASRHRLLNEAALAKRVAALEALLAADAQAPTPSAAPVAAAQPAAPAAAPVAAAQPQAAAPRVPAWMAKKPASRRAQRRRYAQAEEQLKQRHAHNHRKAPSKQTPPGKIVVSVSDPEAVIGLDKENVYRPLYNVQVVDDLDSPFILAYEVLARVSDAGLLGTMLQRTQAMTEGRLKEVLTAMGYIGGSDLKAAASAGVTVYAPLPKESGGKAKQVPKSAFTWLAQEQTYVGPQGHRLELEATGKRKRAETEDVVVQRYRCPPEHCRSCPLRQACAQKPEAGRTVSRNEHEEEVEALRARMASAEAQGLYQRRRQTVELVNADWKAHRKLRRLSGRGLARARCQIGLLVLVHNLLTLLVEEKKAQATAVAAVSPADDAT